jgi:hypothetical protein
MTLCYRIHSGSEPAETVLDPRRPDGWVAGDEDLETQPHGISVCDSLEDLRRYIRTYSMSVRPGDRLLVLSGHICGDDRDDWACRAEIEEVVEVLPLSALYDEGPAPREKKNDVA